MCIRDRFVIALPDGPYGHVSGGEGQIDGRQRPGDAQLRRSDGVEPHIDDRTGILIIGVHPHQFGHPPHAVHQPVARGAQRVDVAAVEAEFERCV